jgi:aspartyl protease family protein
MKAPPFLIVAGVGIAMGFASPDRSTPSPIREVPRKSSGSNPWSTEQAQSAQASDYNSGEVILSRHGDGHFYADVTIESVPTQMLVDTGASVIALTGSDAEAMGIYWEESEIQPVAQGASGAVYGLPVTLDRVQLGDIEVRGVEAIVVPSGLGVSLLGQSFLGRIKDVQIQQDKMVLGSS